MSMPAPLGASARASACQMPIESRRMAAEPHLLDHSCVDFLLARLPTSALRAPDGAIYRELGMRMRCSPWSVVLVRMRGSAMSCDRGGQAMARKYGKASGKKVKRAMHEMKRGKLKSGRSGKTVRSRKQAIAIGLSEARRSGAKVPKKKK